MQQRAITWSSHLEGSLEGEESVKKSVRVRS